MSVNVTVDRANYSSPVFFIQPRFGALDYMVFTFSILTAGAVGIYFYLRGQRTTESYFLGDRSMQPVPVGLSTGVSFLSALILIGMPAEIYISGYSYAIASIFGSAGFLCGSLMMARVLYPVGITSLNEYFVKRFESQLVATVARYLVLGCIFHYIGVCMMGAIIAFESVTGGKVTLIMALTIGSVVAIFYTSIGGIKAVIWTDSIQVFMMIFGICTVIVKAIIDVPGGLSEIYRLNKKYGRIHSLDFSADMTTRHSLWGSTIGNFFTWAVWSAQPANIQRLCSVSSLRDSYIVAAVSGSLFLLFSLLPAWAGFNIFGYYASRGCDVFAADWIKRNEIVLYYVRERLYTPGFQGLFLAALYAGSLSSLSSALNAATAIVWNDSIKPSLKQDVSETKALVISKIIVLSIGILGMGWTIILNSFGGMILQVAASIDSSTFGAYFSIAFVGMFFRIVNARGITVGFIVGFIITFWLGIGQLLSGSSEVHSLGMTVENCNSNVSVNRNTTQGPSKNTFILYEISYLWLTPICIFLTITISVLVSLPYHRSQEVDEKFMVPFPNLMTVIHNLRNRTIQETQGQHENMPLNAIDITTLAEQNVNSKTTA